MASCITEHIDIWTAAQTQKTNGGRGRGNGSSNQSPHGIKKLRELILELAVRGKLVSQDPNDEAASVLLEKISKEKARLVKEGKIKKQERLPEINDDEKPFGLPQGWEWVRLGDIGDTNIGLTYSPKDISDIGTPVLRSNNVQKGKLELTDLVRVNMEIKKSVMVQEGDLLICARNGSKALVGKTAQITGLSEEMAFGAFMAIFRSPINDYVLYFINSPLFRKMIDDVNTTTINQITQNNLKTTMFPLLPLSEQHRIVAKVDELMAICDLLEQQQNDSKDTLQTLVETLLATLTTAADQDEFSKAWQRIAENFETLFTTEHSIDKLKQTILQLAVMGKLALQDPNDEPASVLLEKIAKEKMQLVEEEALRTKAKTEIDPKEEYINRQIGWEYCRLGNLAKFIDYRGRTPQKIESGVPLITAKNVRFGFLSREPQEFISDDEYDAWMTRGFPKIGDILFTTEAPLGNIAIVDIEEKFALAQRVICFQLHEPDLAPFLKVLMMSLAFHEQLADQATGMTATGIKSSKLKEIPVPIPPLAEQHRIVAKVDELMALCDILKARLNDAQTTQVQLADTIVEQAVV